MTRPRLRNAPLAQVVCELRFPPRPALTAEKVDRIADALGEYYDAYSVDQGLSVQVGPGGMTPQQISRHRFEDSDGWAVTIGNETLSVETTSYRDIDDFVGRWRWVHGAVQDSLKLRSVTRIGFRYINQMPLGDGTLADELATAVDDRLLASWAVAGEAADPVASLQELRVATDGWGLTVRHGLVPDRTYLLDFDCYREAVHRPATTDGISDVLREFNEVIAQAFERSVTRAQWDKFDPAERV